ncbi:MAG: hypothetical protein ACHQVS_01200 [Candidatus Babeliales bacterium]
MKTSFSLILLILATSCMYASDYNPKERGAHRHNLKKQDLRKQKEREVRAYKESEEKKRSSAEFTQAMLSTQKKSTKSV